MAFDLTSEDSFHALRAIFLPLLDSALPACVKVVIGTKLDLLPTFGRAVSVLDGQNLATEINEPSSTIPPLYFETSSLTGLNVDEVFETLFSQCLPVMQNLNQDCVSGTNINLISSSLIQKPKSSCNC